MFLTCSCFRGKFEIVKLEMNQTRVASDMDRSIIFCMCMLNNKYEVSFFTLATNLS